MQDIECERTGAVDGSRDAVGRPCGVVRDVGAWRSYECTSSSKVPQPQSEWEALLAHLHNTPADREGWNRLVCLAVGSGDSSQIKAAYDSLLEVYPGAVSHHLIDHVCVSLQ